MRKRDDHAVARAHESGEVVFCLSEPSRRDSGTLSLERHRLAGREGIELCGGPELELTSELLFPHGAHRARLPDKVEPWNRWHEIAGLPRFFAVVQLGFAFTETERPFCGGIHDRRLHLV